MGQRLAGIAVLLTAALVLSVVSGLQPTNVSGTASAEPGPPAPVPGDCLLAPAAGQNEDLQLGPCDGPAFGEVYLVGPPLSASSTDLVPCLDETALTSFFGAPHDDENPWRATFVAAFLPASPSRTQLASGQEWQACVVVPWEEIPYEGSLHDVWGAGAPPVAYAYCAASDDVVAAPAACTDPHTAEIFGSLDGNTAIAQDAAQLDAACTALIKRSTGMPDVTAGGELQVASEVVTSTVNLTQDSTPIQQTTSSGTCGLSVVGDRILTGTLLGIGIDPLPWG